MLQDIWFGFRMLRRSPGFSIIAILCLTLGIGATAAVFSLVEGVLLRPYNLVADQDRLMVLSGTAPGASKGTDLSWPDFLDFRQSCTLIDAFIAEKIVGTTLSVGGDRAQTVSGSVVSANYFDAMGIHPILGRGFEPADETGRKAHPVVVISYKLWQERYHGDPAIVGKSQVLNGLPHTIIGVTPEGFFGTFVGYTFQFWVPVSMQETFDPGGYKLEDRDARWIEGFVRLKPGVTQGQAQAEIAAVAKRLEAQYPTTNRARNIRLLPLWQSPFNPMENLGPTLEIALAVVTAVLLIACANVGNLMLLKAFARRREMTIRLAAGAGRGRLLKQLLTEGLILSVLSAVGGIMVAYWSRNALSLAFPPRNGGTLRLPADLDWRVLLMSAGVCLVSTLLFALAPAILASKIDLIEALKSESGGVVGGHRKALVRSGLVLVQISLSFVLLVGLCLVGQSLLQMRRTNPGFSTDVQTTRIDLVAAGYDTPRARVFEDELLDRIRMIGGVQSAVFMRTTPFTYRPYGSGPIQVDGYQAPSDEAPEVDYNEVGPGYFSTMGIPIASGREFTRQDDEASQPVAIVDETMAAQYWHGENPLGKRLQLNGRAMQVIGLARNTKYGNLLEKTRPFFYLPSRQNSLPLNLAIRTSLRADEMVAALAREIHVIDPNLAPSEILSMREQVDRTTSSQTLAVMLLGVFGGLALLLSAIGLYGVISYSVSQSTRELGLRMAMGAVSSDLLQLVLAHGLSLTAAGVAFGAVVAFMLTRLMGYLLYNVSPTDPLSFAAAFVILFAASLAACLIPALRAMRTDPIDALRN